jgi:anti-sigma factor RsiW
MKKGCSYEKAISAFMDGELPESKMRKMRQHIKGCSECRARLALLRQVRDHLLDSDDLTLSSDFDARFQAKLAAERRRTHAAGAPRLLPEGGVGMLDRVRRFLSSSWRPLALGMAALGVLAFFIMRTSGGPLPAEELALAENYEILNNYEIITNLDLFENWDAVNAMKAGS